MISDNLGDRAMAACAEKRDVACLIAGQPIQLEAKVWMRGGNSCCCQKRSPPYRWSVTVSHCLGADRSPPNLIRRALIRIGPNLLNKCLGHGFWTFHQGSEHT